MLKLSECSKTPLKGYSKAVCVTQQILVEETSYSLHIKKNLYRAFLMNLFQLVGNFPNNWEFICSVQLNAAPCQIPETLYCKRF